MSLLSDMIVAGIKGIKFNPQFYEDKRYKAWLETDFNELASSDR